MGNNLTTPITAIRVLMHTSALEVFFHIMRYINLHITLYYITSISSRILGLMPVLTNK